MSSNYSRMTSVQCRIACWYCTDRTYFGVLSMDLGGHAAVNDGRQLAWGLRSVAGGEAGERHHTASGVGRGGVVAPESRRGVGAVVHRRVGFLSGLRQGAGEIRDAAGASSRGCVGGRGCCGTWLFAGSVLSSGGGVRAGGDGGAARRAAWASWPGEATTGDRGVYPRRGRVGGPDRRAGGRPVRSAVASAHHRAGAPAVSTRSFW